MKVLLTNDDGISSPSFRSLVRRFTDNDQITIAAPRTEMSAVSHSLTIRTPLYCQKQNIGPYPAYSITGSPADCVKLALDKLCPEPPDLVISGINMGSNCGINVFYSGTVAAAMEASLQGYPAIAVSLNNYQPADFEYASRITYLIAQQIMLSGPPKGMLLNINIPDLPEYLIKGFRITRQVRNLYKDAYLEDRDSDGNTCYRLSGSRVDDPDDPDFDDAAMCQGWISITPLRTDFNTDVYPSFLQTLIETESLKFMNIR